METTEGTRRNEIKFEKSKKKYRPSLSNTKFFLPVYAHVKFLYEILRIRMIVRRTTSQLYCSQDEWVNWLIAR